VDQVAIVEASSPNDLAAIATIDTGFTATEMLAVETREGGFALTIKAVDRTVWKAFPLDDVEQQWQVALVARVGSSTVGFASGNHHRWNRRLVISHFYVDRKHRRKGVETALMNAMVARGRQLGADHLWIETSNLNVPAVAAYQQWGFELCGLDTAFYRATPARGEVAIFLSFSL